jgi:hypothetical protein
MPVAKDYSRVSQAFSEPEIDHFVMAITAAEAIVRHTTPIRRLVAVELIGWESSDAHEHDTHEHDTSVCRCRRFDRD